MSEMAHRLPRFVPGHISAEDKVWMQRTAEEMRRRGCDGPIVRELERRLAADKESRHAIRSA